MYQFLSKPDAYIGVCGDLRCRVTEYRVPGAPAFMRAVRAVLVTDIHALPRTSDAAMDGLAARVAGAKPDILLFGGDYADKPEPARRLFRRLRGVSAPLGAYAVAGNNDREAFPNLDVLDRLLWENGFELLVNESRRLRMKGGHLIVAGLDEYEHGSPDARGLYPEMPAPDRYRLLLSHYPHDVTPMPDLMLSGHTHGGQFNALGLTPYTIGFERLLTPKRASRFIAGLHEWQEGHVLVSKGIGASRIPLRIGVAPEINVIMFVE